MENKNKISSVVGRLDPGKVCPSKHDEMYLCDETEYCPAILKLDDDNILVIGDDVTDEYKDKLDGLASCGPNEKIVKIPSDILTSIDQDVDISSIDLNMLKDKDLFIEKSSSSQFFKIALNGLSNKFYKFESRQSYDGVGGKNYEAYKSGDKALFARALVDFYKRGKDLADTHRKKGVIKKRLHLIKYPLDDYLIFEYYTYIISEMLGEDIKFILEKDINKDAKLEDFTIYDDRFLFFQEYNTNNEPLGVFVRNDNKTIKFMSSFFEENFSKGIPFREMMHPDMEIINLFNEFIILD